MSAGKELYASLDERGFIYQKTASPEDLAGLLDETVSVYIGFDPTADSLHVGSLVPLMALRHVKRAGHRVILLTGSGTAMVGDPSGKTEMRPMMTARDIECNASRISSQLSRIVDDVDGGPDCLALDNASWLEPLGYIQFLRQCGRFMSINRMLSRESARRRYESEEGLSFLEFNYMCLQAFDFLHLYQEHGCRLQMGGQDQWGNICEGIDLISRPELGSGRAYGITFPLLLSSSGEKFGKTAAGAVWLDPARTPPFDYYQFWRNVSDEDVERYLLLFTELDAEAIKAQCRTSINRSKEILAFECTRILHGNLVAQEVYSTACAQFRCADVDGAITMGSTIPRVHASVTADVSVPEVRIPAADFPVGVLDLLVRTGLVASKGEARRILRQGGVYVDGQRLLDENDRVDPSGRGESGCLVSIGKKRRRRVVPG